MQNKYCSICRDPPDIGESLQKCLQCKSKFHVECISLQKIIDNYICQLCNDESKSNTIMDKNASKHQNHINKQMKNLLNHNKVFLKKMNYEKYLFLKEHSIDFEIFNTEFFNSLRNKDNNDHNHKNPRISELEKKSFIDLNKSPDYIINGCLRDYQLHGISTLNTWFMRGIGGILADEMGLGKTIQTISFLAGLKHMLKLSGPHLIVTPLAVLQNWANELNRFCPTLSYKKLYGTASERKQLFTNENVNTCQYDVYLTTYETLITEEAFFTDRWPWITITIDEGHRIKNENAKLRLALSRLRCPFRILLTGTPLQNNLHELWALLDYILPEIFHDSSYFDNGYKLVTDQLDTDICNNARRILESFMMLRRVKLDVEKTLLSKKHFKFIVPLTKLQKKWYQVLLYGQSNNRYNDNNNDNNNNHHNNMKQSNASSISMLSQNQLLHILSQLRKVVNHPKQIYLKRAEERVKEQRLIEKAEYAGSNRSSGVGGSEYHIQVPMRKELQLENELKELIGEKLIKSCGKLMVLDRLLLKLKSNGSRCLIFSQFTETLDILEEYVNYRFGPLHHQVYYRLDGSTNRILREMHTKAFNHPDSQAFIYLISTTAGGVGINLASADSVILYDSSWNPQVDLQAQDRAHRIGQKKQVSVYRFVSEHTFEEHVLQIAEKKQLLDTLVIANHPSTNTTITSSIENNQDLSISELVNIVNHGSSSFMNSTSVNIDINNNDEVIVNDRIDKYIDSVLNDSNSVGENKKDITNTKNVATSTTYTDSSNNDKHIDGNNISDQMKDVIEIEEVQNNNNNDDDNNNNNNSSIIINTRKRKVKIPIRYEPTFKINNNIKKIRISEDICFCCNDGGTLLECDECPKVYHLECIGLTSIPASSRYSCPWHVCIECDRKASNCGGMLFRCMDCPISYCFDCYPKEKEMINYPTPISISKNFDIRGYILSKNILFYRCDECEITKGKYIPSTIIDNNTTTTIANKNIVKKSTTPVKRINNNIQIYNNIATQFAYNLETIFKNIYFCDLLMKNQVAQVIHTTASSDTILAHNNNNNNNNNNNHNNANLYSNNSIRLHLNILKLIDSYWEFMRMTNNILRPITDTLFRKLLINSYMYTAYYQHLFIKLIESNNHNSTSSSSNNNNNNNNNNNTSECIIILSYEAYQRQELTSRILSTYLLILPEQITKFLIDKATFSKLN